MLQKEKKLLKRTFHIYDIISEEDQVMFAWDDLVWFVIYLIDYATWTLEKSLKYDSILIEDWRKYWKEWRKIGMEKDWIVKTAKEDKQLDGDIGRERPPKRMVESGCSLNVKTTGCKSYIKSIRSEVWHHTGIFWFWPDYNFVPLEFSACVWMVLVFWTRLLSQQIIIVVSSSFWFFKLVATDIVTKLQIFLDNISPNRDQNSSYCDTTYKLFVLI